MRPLEGLQVRTLPPPLTSLSYLPPHPPFSYRSIPRLLQSPKWRTGDMGWGSWKGGSAPDPHTDPSTDLGLSLLSPTSPSSRHECDAATLDTYTRRPAEGRGGGNRELLRSSRHRPTTTWSLPGPAHPPTAPHPHLTPSPLAFPQPRPGDSPFSCRNSGRFAIALSCSAALPAAQALPREGATTDVPKNARCGEAGSDPLC